MAKFKVGDRVRYTGEGDTVPFGTIGTVLEDSKVPFVDWDGFTGGHDVMFDDGRMSVCSVHEDDLELIEEEKESPKIKTTRTVTPGHYGPLTVWMYEGFPRVNMTRGDLMNLDDMKEAAAILAQIIEVVEGK